LGRFRPSYEFDLSEKADKDDRSFSYNGACNATVRSPGFDQLEHGAVASATAYGDGCYPVYAEVDDTTGVIKSLVIEFE
jgi:hypothetical protein